MASTRSALSRVRGACSALLALAAATCGLALPTAAHATGGTTYYVDSAAGSDSNSGTSQASP